MPSAGIGGAGHTRRGFLGAVIAAGAAETVFAPLASAGEDAPEQPSAPESPGTPTAALAVAPDRRTVWTANTRISMIRAHRGSSLKRARSIEVGGAPIGVAISPAGDLALVADAGYERPGLVIVELPSGRVDRLDVGPEPYSVAFAPDGGSAYVAGGGLSGTLSRVDPRSGKVDAPIPVGRHPRGLAIDPEGERALVALNGDAALADVSLGGAGGVRRIRTGAYPHQVAIAPDGARALTTHNGFGAASATPIDLGVRRAGEPVAVGADPSGVAFSESGALALVVATKARTVTLLDGRSWRRRGTVRTGGAPRSVAVAGARAVVVDGGTGKLTAIPLGTGA